MKKLGDLIFCSKNYQNLKVTDVVDDSRKAIQGSMFVALDGNAVNGKNYIKNAIDNGAKFIVTNGESEKIETEDEIVFISVKNSRKELASICSKFWNNDFDNLIAVTGTNGKSSTVDIVRQVWINSGINSASIGTLGIISKNFKISGSLTSPGAVALGHIFEKLHEEKIKNVVMEASSHGLDQHRLDCIKFSVCAFTNFTQDHLDYHKTFENYWKAKERLFSELANENTTFVINSDDAMSEKIKCIAKDRHIKCVDFGKNSKDIKLISSEEAGQYQKVKISFFDKPMEFNLSLAGDFQIYNTLCSMGICYFTGIDPEKICESFEKLNPISGRLELVGEKDGASIYTDYAHTPDALKNALLSLRKHTKKRLVLVFGCGGDRDKDKRHIMGQIVNEFADLSIVTDDNPRNENPIEIRKMILDGCPNATEIGDRKEAIKSAISCLKNGDVLLVAGKGHEDYQILASGKIHFSDKEIILGEIK